jgi:preprotein translocase subunit YajC
MCYRTAEAQQGARSRVLNSGILILLLPPVLLMAGIIWFAWRRNRQQAPEKAVAELPD